MKTKICFVSSSGGHFEELMQLNELFNGKSYIITEKTSIESKRRLKTYYYPQVNRKELMFIPKFIYISLFSFFNLIKENPAVIISTGALCSFPICLIGKLLRKKIIYIESFARIHDKSLTGNLVYKFADLFIVQWKEMLDIYPNAIFGGGIFK